jgi:hypothetical protein
MKFRLHGRSAVTGRRGRAHLPVPRSATFVTRSGQRRLRDGALPRMTDTRHRPYEVARLSRYYRGGAIAALARIFKVKLRFVDRSGAPVDPALVQSVVLKSITGVRYTLSGDKPLVLPGTRVAPFSGELLSKDLEYSLEKVIVDGTNVVNRAQQRFEPRRDRMITVKLLFFRAKFTSRDAIFGFHIGSNIALRYPSGAVRRYKLGPDGAVVLPALPRGDYRVTVHGPGFSFTRPVSVSRRQVVDLKVISYLDMAVVAAAAGAFVLALLVVRRKRALRADALLPEAAPEPIVPEHAEVLVTEPSVPAGPPGGDAADKALTPRQEKQIANAICRTHPEKFALPEPLWTPELVADLIALRLGVDLEIEAIPRYLHEWGVVTEDAVPPASDRYDGWVPGDRFVCVLRLTTSTASWRRVIAAVANDGALSFLVFKSRLTPAVVIDFLHRLMWQNAGRKIVVLADGHRVYRSREVRAWVERRAVVELQLPRDVSEPTSDEPSDLDLATGAGEPDAATEPHVTHSL